MTASTVAHAPYIGQAMSHSPRKEADTFLLCCGREYVSALGAPGKVSPYFPSRPPFPPFVVPVLGAPHKAGVMSPFRPQVGLREGRGEVAWAGGGCDFWG